MEQKLDTLSQSLEVMKELLLKKGVSTNDLNGSDSQKRKKHDGGDRGNVNVESSNSETTIYRNVLDKIASREPAEITVDPEIVFNNRRSIGQKKPDKLRVSSSSDEQIDTSDELMEVDIDMNECFIADCEAEAKRKREHPDHRDKDPARQQADDYIHDVEAAKAKMLQTTGNELNIQSLEFNSPRVTTAVDENYILVGSHVDLLTREKIQNGSYVDFAKLLPKDRSSLDDNRMELISKGGQTFFVLAADRENAGITNFHKWEQAFRIYSNIYLKALPIRSTELI